MTDPGSMGVGGGIVAALLLGLRYGPSLVRSGNGRVSKADLVRLDDEKVSKDVCAAVHKSVDEKLDGLSTDVKDILRQLQR